MTIYKMEVLFKPLDLIVDQAGPGVRYGCSVTSWLVLVVFTLSMYRGGI